jgi:hypothetical protein
MPFFAMCINFSLLQKLEFALVVIALSQLARNYKSAKHSIINYIGRFVDHLVEFQLVFSGRLVAWLANFDHHHCCLVSPSPDNSSKILYNKRTWGCKGFDVLAKAAL